MAGIAGIESKGEKDRVARMLEQIAYRGESGCKIIESHGITLGAVWSDVEPESTPSMLREQAVWDGNRPPLPEPSVLEGEREPFALAAATPEGVFLARDPLGICPLYYGRTDEGDFCFGSEAKAVLRMTEDVRQFAPGTWYNPQEGFQSFYSVGDEPELNQDAAEIAGELRLRLERAVSRRVDKDVMGCWLSGNLNSSTIAALARPHVESLHTFAVGTPATPDLDQARQVATFLETEHHEITITLEEVLAPLPVVIWHLESFDVSLVRSSVTRYLAAKQAADYVGTILFDEGANELFGGSDYLKELEPEDLADEMVELTQRLHHTSLQRVDRIASSHGLVAQVPFLDLDVFEYTTSIPVELKLRRNGETTDKWILRRALTGVLPEDVLRPSVTTRWKGEGVGFLLALSAEEQITDADFHRERALPSGWLLNSKEELMYYRIFRELFGDVDDLSWMGRTREHGAGTIAGQ
jgi:asparagine synthase (glutamine-hydrolysing)